MNEAGQYIKITLLMATIIILLYVMDVKLVVASVNGFQTHWNDATVYIFSFKDRHPWIMLSMPFMSILMLATLKGSPDDA